MKLRLLDGPAEDYRAIVISANEDRWGDLIIRKHCWRCGNEFDLRRANAEEWICGECIAIYRGGQEALDAYIAQHPKHYGKANVPSELELRKAAAEKLGWTDLHLCLHGELYGFDPKTGLEMPAPQIKEATNG